ncbi:MAG: polysaccharide biosynthesis protein [Clostridiales bacterium]|nr:polysaccharide biosynthesis protein [Clostridiales bacterium]
MKLKQLFSKLIGSKGRRFILLLFDMLCFCAIDAFCLLIMRRTNAFSGYTTEKFLINSAILLVSIMAFRLIMGVYGNVWRYTNTNAYFMLVLADCFGGLLALLISRVFGTYTGIWHCTTAASLNAIAALMSRFSYRLIYRQANAKESSKPKVNVAIVGAGRLGTLLANDLHLNDNSGYNPVFFIDTDNAKIGNKVSGYKVFREDGDIFNKLKAADVEEIFITLGTDDSTKIQRLYDFYSGSGCKIKLYDTPVSDKDGAVSDKRVIRQIQIEDLLFRTPVSLENTVAQKYYEGKTVLVTGGGGSIGSELCRQIAKCNPKKLVIFDIYENNAYDIEQELWRAYGKSLDLSVEIGSVRDRARLDDLFSSYRPDVVFHAAAHKHVPLMENSGAEAIKNNVFGTYNTADMAEKYGAEKFIMISTDKAVNPTNIMGASKRMCEMIIQSRKDGKTSFAAVRFGNVLGSNGSVIPLFKKQIEAGGPVTITDKRIIRYFMTIPEASQLVMQAGAMAKKGELFVLDMGKPIKIYDLAVNMIKLSGYTPDEDIEIKEIGLRPGEKLYEELLIKTEKLTKTDNDKIFVENDTPLSRSEVDKALQTLADAVKDAKCGAGSLSIREALKKVVPTFRNPEELNKDAEKSEEMKKISANV